MASTTKTHDPRVDAYIAKAKPFARPILEHLRSLVHDACPDVEETIKWGFPVFLHHGMLCNMAAFSEHCSFGFWKGSLLEQAGLKAKRDAMGQLGRLESVKDVPGKAEFRRLVKAAMKLNEQGIKVERAAKKRPEIPVPADLAAALARNKKARTTFEGFAPGQRREYLEWITEAKRAETREKRIAQAIEWLAEGKQRNWKYADC